MKLNKTYPLDHVLESTSKASDKLGDVVREMKKAGDYSRDYVVYETIGMLTTSPFARVTPTRSNEEGTRWDGYMETSAFADGPKTHVAIRKAAYVAVADENYRNITIIAVDA